MAPLTTGQEKGTDNRFWNAAIAALRFTWFSKHWVTAASLLPEDIYTPDKRDRSSRYLALLFRVPMLSDRA